ncbi:DUF4411 family protein [Bradyrhizobium sp. 44]|uniref:DUF4411 family protein n=1 Tax=Bradyrhizobium sp. 44 TaxID=2782675 RepID=UPI001FF94637|nr:DUF4411 family protein [Bradyrhizobium sp. 44]MCK1283440.1 DUF4411 family protein [Bradyrhizobium sp. 44]
MKKHCFDTSGISNPLETMPEDIHESAWTKIKEKISSGEIAVTREVYDEMTHVVGTVGQCIKDAETELLLEVGEGDWDYNTYTAEAVRMQEAYAAFIAENTGKAGTVGLNDISIIALAKTLKLPVVSMEVAVNNDTSAKRRIPDICKLEGVQHMTFSEYCRAENLRF